MSVICSPQPVTLNSTAHADLLRKYHAKTQDGLWHTLPDDGYIHTHLTWHMEQALWWDEIHQLFQEENSAGHSGWYHTCLKHGHLETYAQDIERAWRLAECVYDQNPTRAITLQVRYASLTSIFNSFASQIPAPLLAALVAKNIWDVDQGWAFIKKSSPGEQVAALECLVSHLSSIERVKALDTVIEVSDISAQARLLTVLIPYLSEILLSRVLDCVEEMTSEHYQSIVLCSLSRYLPSRLTPRALSLVTGINDETTRLMVLSHWIQHHTALLPEILVDLKQIQDPIIGSQILCMLAPHLTPHDVPSALQVVEEFADQDQWCTVMSVFAIQHPFLISDVLDQVDQLNDEFTLAEVLGNLAVNATLDSKMRIWSRVCSITNETARTLGLSLVAPYLPETMLPKLLLEIQRLQLDRHRAQVLAKLYFRSNFHPQMLTAVDSMQDQESIALVLVPLVSVQPNLIAKTLQIIQEISNEPAQARLLCHLAPHLPQANIEEALHLALGITALSPRIQALSGLAMYLPEHLLHQVLMNVLKLMDPLVFDVIATQLDSTSSPQLPISKASVLKALTSALPEDLLAETVQVIDTFEDPLPRARALSPLLPQLNVSPANVENWCDRLHCLASRPYQEFFPDLLKLGVAIEQLGGPECLSEIAGDLRTLQEQWTPLTYSKAS